MTTYIIDYYPVHPYSWFHIYEEDHTHYFNQLKSDYEIYEEEYLNAKLRNVAPIYYKNNIIYGLNNQWWMKIECENIDEACKIFFDTLRNGR